MSTPSALCRPCAGREHDWQLLPAPRDLPFRFRRDWVVMARNPVVRSATTAAICNSGGTSDMMTMAATTQIDSEPRDEP